MLIELCSLVLDLCNLSIYVCVDSGFVAVGLVLFWLLDTGL